MADKRMFSKAIIDSDMFLDMPLSTQALYFHLSMRADDDGFINNPKKIQRMVGCGDDDFKLLVAKDFVIPFQSGVVVIKHWRIHNCIKKDRYKETVYLEEKSMLSEGENKAWRLVEPEWNQSGTRVDTQIRLDKNRLDKSREDKNICASDSIFFDADYQPEKIDYNRDNDISATRFYEKIQSNESVYVHGYDLCNFFENIWDEYPKKADKKNAAIAFFNFVKKDTKERLIEFVINLDTYKKVCMDNGTERRFIRNMQGFVNSTQHDEHPKYNCDVFINGKYYQTKQEYVNAIISGEIEMYCLPSNFLVL